MELKVVVGLGNPGLRYTRTRHNLGFWVLDRLSECFSIPLTKHKFAAKYGDGRINNQRIILVKPQTFMNLSGRTVADLVNFYQLELKNLFVIYDDLDLDAGFLRIKSSGSAGGHRGMLDIIEQLGSDQFPRLRVGIGQPPPFLNAADYVLQVIDETDVKILEDAACKAAKAVEMWLHEDLINVMNHYNRKQTKKNEL